MEGGSWQGRSGGGQTGQQFRDAKGFVQALLVVRGHQFQFPILKRPAGDGKNPEPGIDQVQQHHGLRAGELAGERIIHQGKIRRAQKLARGYQHVVAASQFPHAKAVVDQTGAQLPPQVHGILNQQDQRWRLGRRGIGQIAWHGWRWF